MLVGRKKLRLDGKTKYVETEVGTLSDGDHPYKWLQRSTRENELKLIFRTRWESLFALASLSSLIGPRLKPFLNIESGHVDEETLANLPQQNELHRRQYQARVYIV